MMEQYGIDPKLVTPSGGSLTTEEPLHLGDTAHLSIDGMGIVLFSPEVMKSVVPAAVWGGRIAGIHRGRTGCCEEIF